MDFCKRLNDFYYQFRSFGNNYNQIVKKIHQHFSEREANAVLSNLTKETRQLKMLSMKIIELTEEFKQKLL